MQIAREFINISADEIFKTKQETLEKLGQFVSADRAYIFEYDFNNETCSNTFEWCNYDVEPQIDNLQSIPLNLMREWVDSNISGEIMSIPRVEDLPNNNLRQILSQQGIKSLLVLPIINQNGCLGFVGFDSVKSHYNYSEKEKDVLFFFAQMIANVDMRHKNELELRYNNELQKTLLSNIQSGIIFEDENNNIIFANELFCELFSISDVPESLNGLNCQDCLEISKNLFVDSEKFAERIGEIVHKKEIVTNEILKMVDGKFLERDYIPLFVNDEYKGHLWKYNDISHQIKSRALLEQSEERNRLIMQSALNAIITIDTSGQISFWNKQAEQIFGWKMEEVIGKKLEDNIIPIQHKKGHAEGLNRYLESGEGPALNKLLELPAVKKDGTEVIIEIAIIPIKQDGELFFCSFIQDISERKKAETQLIYQERKFRNIISNMNLGLIEVDNNGLIQYANQSFSNISGYSNEELIGKDPIDIFVEEKDKIIMESKAELRAQGISDLYQIPVKNKNGEIKWWAVSGAPNIDDNGNVLGTIGIHLDITEQKKLELELENEKQIALNASKAKEVFLSTMSHEIRTPLHGIIGMNELLLKTDTTPQQSRFARAALNSGKTLLHLISEILDLAKIEADRMDIESVEFDLVSVIDEVCYLQGEPAQRKGLKLDFDDIHCTFRLLLKTALLFP